MNQDQSQSLEEDRINREDNFWCPNAACEGTGLCEPCKNKYLFVLATGRSGSTTIMAMLNLLPGIRIAGENNDVMYDFQTMVNNLTSLSNFKIGSDVKNGCWFHERIEKASFACPAQELLRTINPPNTELQKLGKDDAFITGFKEIRWLRHEEFKGDVSKFLDTYLPLFPCSRFIFSIRSDVKNQAKSGFYGVESPNSTEAELFLKHLNDIHIKLFNYIGKERAFLLNMNEWTLPGGGRHFTELAQWLGFENCFYPDDIGNCWNYVNRNKMSKTDICKSQTQDFSFGQSCMYNPFT